MKFRMTHLRISPRVPRGTIILSNHDSNCSLSVPHKIRCDLLYRVHFSGRCKALISIQLFQRRRKMKEVLPLDLTDVDIEDIDPDDWESVRYSRLTFVLGESTFAIV